LHGGALIARTAGYGTSWRRATEAMLACITAVSTEGPLPRSGTWDPLHPT
jgi:hypothetical protein